MDSIKHRFTCGLKHGEDEQDGVQVQSHCAQTEPGLLGRGAPHLSHKPQNCIHLHQRHNPMLHGADVRLTSEPARKQTHPKE